MQLAVAPEQAIAGFAANDEGAVEVGFGAAGGYPVPRPRGGEAVVDGDVVADFAGKIVRRRVRGRPGGNRFIREGGPHERRVLAPVIWRRLLRPHCAVCEIKMALGLHSRSRRLLTANNHFGLRTSRDRHHQSNSNDKRFVKLHKPHSTIVFQKVFVLLMYEEESRSLALSVAFPRLPLQCMHNQFSRSVSGGSNAIVFITATCESRTGTNIQWGYDVTALPPISRSHMVQYCVLLNPRQF